MNRNGVRSAYDRQSRHGRMTALPQSQGNRETQLILMWIAIHFYLWSPTGSSARTSRARAAPLGRVKSDRSLFANGGHSAPMRDQMTRGEDLFTVLDWRWLPWRACAQPTRERAKRCCAAKSNPASPFRVPGFGFLPATRPPARAHDLIEPKSRVPPRAASRFV